MKSGILMAVWILILSGGLVAQDPVHMLDRLNFLEGDWTSHAKNLLTGEASHGYSEITPEMNGKWLKWQFVSRDVNNPFEVMTMINYHPQKKQYAFYSFNPFDAEPLPHYGSWTSDSTLVLTIKNEKEHMEVRFILKSDGWFEQIHSRVSASGKTAPILQTVYKRNKKN